MFSKLFHDTISKVKTKADDIRTQVSITAYKARQQVLGIYNRSSNNDIDELSKQIELQILSITSLYSFVDVIRRWNAQLVASDKVGANRYVHHQDRNPEVENDLQPAALLQDGQPSGNTARAASSSSHIGAESSKSSSEIDEGEPRVANGASFGETEVGTPTSPTAGGTSVEIGRSGSNKNDAKILNGYGLTFKQVFLKQNILELLLRRLITHCSDFIHVDNISVPATPDTSPSEQTSKTHQHGVTHTITLTGGETAVVPPPPSPTVTSPDVSTTTSPTPSDSSVSSLLMQLFELTVRGDAKLHRDIIFLVFTVNNRGNNGSLNKEQLECILKLVSILLYDWYDDYLYDVRRDIAMNIEYIKKQINVHLADTGDTKSQHPNSLDHIIESLPSGIDFVSVDTSTAGDESPLIPGISPDRRLSDAESLSFESGSSIYEQRSSASMKLIQLHGEIKTNLKTTNEHRAAAAIFMEKSLETLSNNINTSISQCGEYVENAETIKLRMKDEVARESEKLLLGLSELDSSRKMIKAEQEGLIAKKEELIKALEEVDMHMANLAHTEKTIDKEIFIIKTDVENTQFRFKSKITAQEELKQATQNQKKDLSNLNNITANSIAVTSRTNKMLLKDINAKLKSLGVPLVNLYNMHIMYEKDRLLFFTELISYYIKESINIIKECESSRKSLLESSSGSATLAGSAEQMSRISRSYENLCKNVLLLDDVYVCIAAFKHKHHNELAESMVKRDQKPVESKGDAKRKTSFGLDDFGMAQVKESQRKDSTEGKGGSTEGGETVSSGRMSGKKNPLEMVDELERMYKDIRKALKPYIDYIEYRFMRLHQSAPHRSETSGSTPSITGFGDGGVTAGESKGSSTDAKVAGSTNRATRQTPQDGVSKAQPPPPPPHPQATKGIATPGNSRDSVHGIQNTSGHSPSGFGISNTTLQSADSSARPTMPSSSFDFGIGDDEDETLWNSDSLSTDAIASLLLKQGDSSMELETEQSKRKDLGDMTLLDS